MRSRIDPILAKLIGSGYNATLLARPLSQFNFCISISSIS